MDPPHLFGSDFIGRTLTMRSSDDPPGGVVYEMDGEVVAELAWSREESAVRMETEVGVCRVRFNGVLHLVGDVVVGEDEVLQARYRGGVARGRAVVGPGRPFDFFSQVGRDVGPWRGIDDAEGVGIVRIRPRLDEGVAQSEVLVTPAELYAPFIGPLLAIFGAREIVHRVRPWLGFTTVLARGR